MIAESEIRIQSQDGQRLLLAPLEQYQVTEQPFDADSLQYVESRAAVGLHDPSTAWQAVAKSSKAVTWAMLAGEDEKYIGFGTLGAGDVMGRLMLERFITDKDFRGRGYGSLAATALTETAFAAGITTVESTTGNPYARRSLHKLGFVDFGEGKELPCGLDWRRRAFVNLVLYNIPLLDQAVSIWPDAGLRQCAKEGWQKYDVSRRTVDIRTRQI